MKTQILGFLLLLIVFGCAPKDMVETPIDELAKKGFGEDVVEDAYFSEEKSEKAITLLRTREALKRQRQSVAAGSTQYEALSEKLRANNEALRAMGFWKQSDLERTALLQRAQQSSL